MKIEELELRDILVEAFEAGFYGCKDLQDNIVENIMSRIKEKQNSYTPQISYTSSTPPTEGVWVGPGTEYTWTGPRLLRRDNLLESIMREEDARFINEIEPEITENENTSL